VEAKDDSLLSRLLLSLSGLLLVYLSSRGSASDFTMKGPKEKPVPSGGSQEIETSCLTTAFMGGVQFYQRWISPVRGIECGFRPSCSHYSLISFRNKDR